MKNPVRVVSSLLPWLAVFACAGIFVFSLWDDLEKYFRYSGIFLSGIIPLGFYHYSLYKQRITQVGRIYLSDAEVDSIYYFGFVITLLTLIAAVFTLSTSGSNVVDPKTIGIQFALGLFVTGYALIGRLHLQVTNRADLEPEDDYANYVDRVNSLLGRVDTAYADLDDLLKRLVERFRTTVESAATENSLRVARQVEDSLAPLVNACQQLANQIGDQGLRNEIESMRTVVTATNRTFRTFDARLQTLSDHAENSAAPLSKLSEALTACERGSLAFSVVLNNLKIDSSITNSISESVEVIGGAFQSFAIAVKRLESDFGGQANVAFRKVNEDLIGSTQILTQSMTQLATAMATSSQTLSDSLKEAISDATEK